MNVEKLFLVDIGWSTGSTCSAWLSMGNQPSRWLLHMSNGTCQQHWHVITKHLHVGFWLREALQSLRENFSFRIIVILFLIDFVDLVCLAYFNPPKKWHLSRLTLGRLLLHVYFVCMLVHLSSWTFLVRLNHRTIKMFDAPHVFVVGCNTPSHMEVITLKRW